MQRFKNSFQEDVEVRHSFVCAYHTKPRLLVFAGFFYSLAAQKRLPHSLIISSENKKASSLFTTQPHEREQRPDLSTLIRLHVIKDSGNIEAAKWCK